VGSALDAVGLLAPAYRLRERIVAWRAPARAGGVRDGVPLPPSRLRVLVDGQGDPEMFVRAGRASAVVIGGALERAGVEITSLSPVLDFGCGCGRVARHWAGMPGLELHGCDAEPALVEWCAEHLGFMQARLNGPEPPLPYAGGSFGLVYAISVLTHLTESLGAAWLRELVRVLRPGGYLLITTHGTVHRSLLPPAERAAFDRGELVVQRPRMAGTNACATFHPRSYVEQMLAPHFDMVSFSGDGANRPLRQDVYLAGPKR
jgi:SAM-dependent methyltransferase